MMHAFKMEELNNKEKHSGTAYVKSCCNNILNGISRKHSLICVLFSFLGWMIFIAGFGVQQRKLDTSGNLAAVRILLAPYWCVLVAGPAAFLLSALHIILGYHFPRVGFILGSFATLAYFLYVSLLSSPLIYSAIIVFGFSGLDIEGVIFDALPIEEVTAILGDNVVPIIQPLILVFCEFTDGGVQFVHEQLLPLVINVQTDLDGAMKAQFSGCVISTVFLALSMVFWQLHSEKETRNPSGSENRFQ